MWELGLFGEMADLGAGAGYIQDEPQASCSPESMKVLSDPTVMEYVKKTGAN